MVPMPSTSAMSDAQRCIGLVRCSVRYVSPQAGEVFGYVGPISVPAMAFFVEDTLRLDPSASFVFLPNRCES